MTIALFALLIAVASQPALAQTTGAQSCAVTPMVRDTAPPDPNADPVGPAFWYINADRSLWAGPVPGSGWPSGGILYAGGAPVRGQKTYWVRPSGTQLSISGRRLDADSPPAEAHIPCCGMSGFQIVALYFPTPGCWEVTAHAGISDLRFITLVSR